MFDSIAPSELMLVAIVALAVIGPKDLPKAMRFVGHWVGKARGMAKHFRSGIDTMMREAELDDLEQQWRAHNEAIMRNYPGFDPFTPPPASGPGAAPAMLPLAPPVADPAAAAAPAPAAAPAAAPSATVTNGGDAA